MITMSTTSKATGFADYLTQRLSVVVKSRHIHLSVSSIGVCPALYHLWCASHSWKVILAYGRLSGYAVYDMEDVEPLFQRLDTKLIVVLGGRGGWMRVIEIAFLLLVCRHLLLRRQ